MNRYLTPSAHAILQRLRAVNDDELDDDSTLSHFTPGGWWISTSQVNARACWHLLRLAAIQADGYSEGGVTYYYLNDEGARLRDDDSYEPLVVAALRERGFSTGTAMLLVKPK